MTNGDVIFLNTYCKSIVKVYQGPLSQQSISPTHKFQMEYIKGDDYVHRITLHRQLDTHACTFNRNLLKIDARNIHGVSDSRNIKVLNSNFFHANFSNLRYYNASLHLLLFYKT